MARWATGVLSWHEYAAALVKILVTGATSLLARTCAELLLARGDQVVLLQRHASPLDTAQVLGDVRDADTVGRAMLGCEAVVHAAAKVGVVGGWDEYYQVNVRGTNNILAAARRNDVPRIVHVSTPSVAHAGDSLIGVGAQPAVTGRRGAFYAESKALAERQVLAASGDGLATVAIRPHLVWGPGDTQLVGRILERARAGRLAMVGSGAALIDTTYVDNAACALVAALDSVHEGAACDGRAYVIANGEPRPICELIEGICVAAGVQAHARRIPLPLARAAGSVIERLWTLRKADDEPPLTRFVAEQLGTAHWFDPRPARQDLGWQPEVSIDEGLRRLRMWFLEDMQSGD